MNTAHATSLLVFRRRSITIVALVLACAILALGISSWKALASRGVNEAAVPAMTGMPNLIVHDGATTADPTLVPTFAWSATTTTVAPLAASQPTAIWTGATGNASTSNRMIVWGGNNGGTFRNTGGIYNPTTNSWVATAISPAARWQHTAVWTGATGNAATANRMIIWGGEGPLGLNTGSRYDPATDTWAATSTGANVPIGRAYHTAVWTGNTGNAATANRMIVFGGFDAGGNALNTGGIYDPATDTWAALPTVGAPSVRWEHSAVWTGNTGNAATANKMIVFGGENFTVALNDGGVFDPATNAWTAIPGSAIPGEHSSHSAVWTGSAMIVFGGYNSAFTQITGGASFNLATGIWTAIATSGQPAVRQEHSGIWTGDRMIIFGGWASSTAIRYSDALAYNPVTNSWATLPPAGAPEGRYGHSAVWAGSQMIVWAGENVTTTINTGGVLDSAPTVALGSQAVGSPLVKSFNIENTGNDDLTGFTISFTGANAADFSVNTAPSGTIVPAGNSAFSINFNPGATGARTARMHITSNDPNRSPYTVILTGTGTVVTTTTVSSINRVGASPVCSGTSVSWTVTFAASVTGVAASNFSLANTGLTSPMITNVTGGGTSWTVTASTGTGGGSLGLNMANSTGVTPAVSNVPFTGQVFTVNAPTTTANAGPDQRILTSTPSVTLGANAPTSGTGAWSIVSGPSTSLAQFSSTTLPGATFTPAGGAGYYILRWTISNAPCTASVDDVLITVANPPTIAKAFSPPSIPAGGTSTVTLTLNNPNPIAPVAAFTDTLTNMTAVGGPVGGTCGLVAPLSLAANATSLNFSGIALPSSGSCVVTFLVSSTVVGTHPNTTSGVTTDLTNGAGAASNTANLMVTTPTMPTITKAFSPMTIPLGGTSTVSLTLNNSGNPTAVIAALTDNLTGMVAVGGGIGGTCATLSAINLTANATALSFSGIVLPGGGSCAVTFDVRGTVSGAQTNTTSGATTDQNAVAGPPSNTATLTVVPTTIAKVFNPATIVSGGTSTVTLTLNNGNAGAVLAAFTDTLTNMTAVGGPIGTTCATLAAINLTAGATNLSFSGLVIPGAGSCTVSFPVTSSVVGSHPNTTSGVTMNSSGVAGPVSNTANLSVTARPTLLAKNAKAVRNDFDGDGKSDLALWRAELGEWQVKFSSDNELHHIQLVEPNDKDEYIAVAADFDGDGRYDAGVYRESDGRWLIKYSLTDELVKAQYGLSGDMPMPADYDGDGRADLAVWRNGDGLHIQRSSNLTELALYVGQAGDVPVIGDFNGDGQMDVAAFSEGHWLLRDTATGQLSDVQFGQAGDTPMAADVDGDGKYDLVRLRPAEAVAYVRRSIDQEVQRMALGNLQSGELVVFGDYNGDGRAELAVWRTVKAAWEVLFNQAPR